MLVIVLVGLFLVALVCVHNPLLSFSRFHPIALIPAPTPSMLWHAESFRRLPALMPHFPCHSSKFLGEFRGIFPIRGGDITTPYRAD